MMCHCMGVLGFYDTETENVSIVQFFCLRFGVVRIGNLYNGVQILMVILTRFTATHIHQHAGTK